MPTQRGSAYRIFGLLAVCLMLVCSGTIVAYAYDQTVPLEVERGASRTIDALEYGKIPGGKVDTATVDDPNLGSSVVKDGKWITYTAADKIGVATVTYKGTDVNDKAFQGEIKFSNVSPKRIVTYDLSRVAGVLGVILVLVIVLEIGLSTLFNWKYFQEHLQDKGLRTPIAIAVSGYFVYHYQLDTIADLLSSFTDRQVPFARTTPGYFITAFIVAGGSSTVYELFRKFGIRTPFEPPAQIVVEFKRQNVPSDRPVNVSIDGKLVATVAADTSRFPKDGSYDLDAGSHEIELEAPDATGAPKKVKQVVNVAPAADVKVTITI
ncbi:hypothetical protein IVB38_06840 [Bradyrhizobium sp. 38]|uniref:hypothetical protein n=1 Tax=unclassified Bradyrhizobium TaxID=2631580 RepID=UPI001FF91303|nr:MULTISPECIES: hypothetical protein [unclassified Bradyrhizobium]MCK1335756.1 hypothetical protein [Bradyrhizobium sp. 38]MCK1776950.1 hypothetical protein [Bradyrhizobium sp. 132]